MRATSGNTVLLAFALAGMLAPPGADRDCCCISGNAARPAKAGTTPAAGTASAAAVAEAASPSCCQSNVAAATRAASCCSRQPVVSDSNSQDSSSQNCSLQAGLCTSFSLLSPDCDCPQVDQEPAISAPRVVVPTHSHTLLVLPATVLPESGALPLHAASLSIQRAPPTPARLAWLCLWQC